MLNIAEMPKYESYKDSGIDWLGDIPSSWELTRLGTCFIERREKVSDVDYPPLSVTKQGILPQLENAAKTKDGDNRKLVKRGDFVINSRSDRKGSSGLSDRDGSVSVINIVLEPKGMHPRFSEHLLKSHAFIEEYYRVGRGIVADLWTTRYNEMRTIVLGKPSYEEQVNIANLLDKKTAQIDEAIALKQKQIELLKERKQIIIQKAVTQGLDPNVQMKDSGVDWIGVIPEHWEIKRLNSVLQFISYGFTCPMPTEDDGPFMLTSNDIGDGYIKFDSARRTSTKAFRMKLSGKSKPAIGDILVTKDGTLGRTALVTINDQICISQSLALLRLKQNVFNEFIEIALRSFNYQEKMVLDAGGTTIKHIYITRLAKMKVALPPIEEQKLIVIEVNAQIEEIDMSSNLISEQIEKLKEYKISLINSAVTGKIKVTPEMVKG